MKWQCGWNACACFALNSAEWSCKNSVIAGDRVFPGMCKDSSVLAFLKMCLDDIRTFWLRYTDYSMWIFFFSFPVLD